MKPRHALARLQAAIQDTPVTLVTGPRQAGKSTLVKSLAGYNYLTLDDPIQRAAAQSAPGSFVAGIQLPVILDEIQRAPELILPIKMAVDDHRKAGQFVLTGSADVFAMPAAGDSLAGRIERIAVYPFTRREIDDLTGEKNPIDLMFDQHPREFKLDGTAIEDLPARITIGGFPEVVLDRARSQRRRSEWFAQYLTSIIDRDFRDQMSPRRASDLLRLIQLLAAEPASELNVSRLAQSISMSQPNVRQYLTILERIYFLETLLPWHNNLTSRLVKSPKTYFVDTGLLCHIAGFDEAGLKRNPQFLGHALENYVVSQLLAHTTWTTNITRMFHFRTLDRYEIDIIIERQNRDIIAIEVKASRDVTVSDFSAMRWLKEKVGERFVRGFVAYGGPSLVAFGDDLFAIPLAQVI
jgi:predicted AAA+ superfamily ATPase